MPWALDRRNIHPLIELRLFKNSNMTVAVIAMLLFAIAFFGASLLFPLYFQQVRGETALNAGLLLAPQGIGAMLTMPIAGMLADQIGPGKIVLTGIAVITVGMAMFTQVEANTAYPFLIGALFVMGLGMGGTMMPIMTAALATLTEHNIARGSTLLNITQQVAASIGTALFSVLLTNGIKDSESLSLLGAAVALKDQPALADLLEKAGLSPPELPLLQARALADMADAFSTVFVVATMLVACCLIPAAFLPRTKAASGRPRGAGGSLTVTSGGVPSAVRWWSRARFLARRACVRLCRSLRSLLDHLGSLALHGLHAQGQGEDGAGACLAEGPAARVRVQPVATRSSTSRTGPPSSGSSISRSKRRPTAATRWAELAAPWPGADARVDDRPACRRRAA